MDQWTTGYFVSRGTKLHYYRAGGAGHALVLIHGISDDGACWTPVAKMLAGTYDVIMMDLRGHGKSDAPDQGYDYETMATEVAGLIEGLELEYPIVMGHSLGAMTSLTLASLYSKMPRAIILEDPPAFWSVNPASQEELETRNEMRKWFYELKRKTRDDLLKFVRSDNPEWSEAELDPWVDSKHRFSLKITQIIDSQDAIPNNFPALLQQITCPALLITADPMRGAIVTDADAAALQKLVPHIKRVRIPDAGHNIRREQFSKYMETVELFLNLVQE